ncbi:RluA family pseudouridine synthase [Thermolongibacillus altinsuensis]|uniref:RluA family pseudouridine synthase n=1 Tax=Thermolongibacillus altinsuensis TaxID=575256 RepID=UPI00242A2A97|nr:RluA family pseudouridine synthase [Thermolongibacillus altinsuensis]GMB08759.1 pseudouridine synthase [Thermolongibacillus altinsuensis]
MNIFKKGEWLDIQVPERWNALSLEYILKNVWQVPKKILHDWKMTNGIKLNGNHVHLQTLLTTNDRLQLHVFKPEPLDIEPTWMPLDILFEDDHVLVLNKPAGIDVHPTDSHQSHTLANAVAFHFQCEGITRKVRHIHRLDRDTSGAILFAKHSLAGAILDRLLAERKIKRTYIALVHGKLKKKKGTINAPIGRDRHHPTKRRVSKTGQPAITHYEVLQYDQNQNVSLVRLQLDTGRTHQIRVHLSYLGHPLVGDVLYGGDPSLPRQALHAISLSFPHPFTEEQIECTAPPTDSVFDLIKKT